MSLGCADASAVRGGGARLHAGVQILTAPPRYPYAPDLFIFNGFLQALVGLDDYRDATKDARGTTLFRAGHAHARWLVPYSDTGSWSLYSLGGPPSTVEYHTLLRDILSNLCKRIGTDVYCTTADRFTAYLTARSP